MGRKSGQNCRKHTTYTISLVLGYGRTWFFLAIFCIFDLVVKMLGSISYPTLPKTIKRSWHDLQVPTRVSHHLKKQIQRRHFNLLVRFCSQQVTVVLDWFRVGKKHQLSVATSVAIAQGKRTLWTLCKIGRSDTNMSLCSTSISISWICIAYTYMYVCVWNRYYIY